MGLFTTLYRVLWVELLDVILMRRGFGYRYHLTPYALIVKSGNEQIRIENWNHSKDALDIKLIEADESKPTLTLQQRDVDEGDKTITFAVTMTGVFTEDITLNLKTVDGLGDTGATAGEDYTSKNFTLDGSIMIEGISFASIENISTLGDEKAINNMFYKNNKESA